MERARKQLEEIYGKPTGAPNMERASKQLEEIFGKPDVPEMARDPLMRRYVNTTANNEQAQTMYNNQEVKLCTTTVEVHKKVDGTDHLTWAIPVVFVVVLIALTVAIKTSGKKRIIQEPKKDATFSSHHENITPQPGCILIKPRESAFELYCRNLKHSEENINEIFTTHSTEYKHVNSSAKERTAVNNKPLIPFKNKVPDKVRNSRIKWGLAHTFILMLLASYILRLPPGGYRGGWLFMGIIYVIILYFKYIAIQIDSIFYNDKVRQFYSDLCYFEIEHEAHLAKIESILVKVNSLTDKEGNYQPVSQFVGNIKDQHMFLCTACFQNIAPFPPPFRRYKYYKYKKRRY